MSYTRHKVRRQVKPPILVIFAVTKLIPGISGANVEFQLNAQTSMRTRHTGYPTGGRKCLGTEHTVSTTMKALRYEYQQQLCLQQRRALGCLRLMF